MIPHHADRSFGSRSGLARRAVAGVALLAALVALGAPAPSAATEIRAVRHWSAPDHTRIVVDLGGPAGYLHRSLENPARIAVDVSHGSFRIPLAPVAIDDGVVKRIRFNELEKSGKAQIVLDLEKDSRYDVFALEPYQEKPNRIVIDVKRATPKVVKAERTPREEQSIGPASFGDFLVMLDPGHGGEDPGRKNRDGLKEKDLVLQYGRDLKRAIDAMPGYRAELTRNGDYFVSLRRRREIAEEQGAHLFVSLHFNAAPSKKARGSEIFFVSLRGAEKRAVQELVEAENSADLVGGLPPTTEESHDTLTKMLVDLRQSDSVERSQQLALTLTDHVSRVRDIKTRPVRQAGFAVLKSLFIPAVLVEVAFLSNREDLRFAKSAKSRARYVKALAEGIVDYCEDVEVPRRGWAIHTVRSGDSLSEIAATYAMSLDTLRSANGIHGDRIRPGQKIRVRPR